MIGRKAALAFAVNLAKNAVGVISLIVVARFMGPEAMGIVGFGFAYVGLFNFLADLGFGVAHIKKVSEGRNLPQCLGTYLLIRLVLTALLILTVCASIPLSRYLPHSLFPSRAHELVIYITLAALAVMNLSNVIGVTFAARRETARQVLPELLYKSVESGFKVLVAVCGFGVLLLAGASLAGTLAALVAYLWLFRGFTIARPDGKLLREYVAFALPVTVIVSANAVTEHLDRVMIQFFRDSVQVGYYVAAGSISNIISMAGVAVGALVFPTVSTLHSRNDQAGIQRLTQRAERLSALLLLPLGVGLSFFSTPVMTIPLGRAFHDAGPVLAALVWATILFVLSVPYSSQIIGTGRARVSAALSVVLMTLNVTLNAVFIPDQLFGFRMLGLGAQGAALATLIATAIMAVLYRLCAARISGPIAHARIGKLALSALAMAAAMYGVSRLPIGDGATAFCAVAALGLIAYGAALRLLGELRREDAAYFLRAFSPGHMKSYIADELRGAQKPEPLE